LSPFDPRSKILVVGDVYVDYHVRKRLARLGGVFHAARSLDAMGVNYAVGYTCPDYLSKQTVKYLDALSAGSRECIGTVEGAPNIILIEDSEESGRQGYEDLLRDDRSVSSQEQRLVGLIRHYDPTDILMFPSRSMPDGILEKVLRCGMRIHIDIQYEEERVLEVLEEPVESLFCSTSSTLFLEGCDGSAERLSTAILGRHARTLLLKENRGGSRAISAGDKAWAEGFAYPTDTVHSVGVGDCFDAAWVAQGNEPNSTFRLARSSFYASLYAATWDHGVFKADVKAAKQVDADIVQMAGVRLPWEARLELGVYIAAPDFPGVNVQILDELEAALKYHNFVPHRPVRENGLYQAQMPSQEAEQLYWADRDLLEQCQMLIAVPLTADPGTFTELGVFAQVGKPTVLYDPFRLAKNLFVEKTADRICVTLAQVIDATFELLGKLGRV
jgi:nucleoside 2-deoxyribosyltransferase